jgi:hypothetical protein
MSSDDKKIKTSPALEKKVPPNDKSGSRVDTQKADDGKGEGSKGEGSKGEGSKIADAVPSGYSRGEGQKPVTKAYKDNWNAIFAKKQR